MINSKRSPHSRTVLFLGPVLAVLLLFSSTPSAHAQDCSPLSPYVVDADRMGMNIVTDYGRSVFDYDADYFGAGWFIDYRPSEYAGGELEDTDGPFAASAETADNLVMLPLISVQPAYSHSMAYVPVLRATDLDGNWQPLVRNLLNRYPGKLWVIGNEPDRETYQDDATPTEYAQLYHDAYEFIKQTDPSAKVAIAGVVQPTRLRMRYLDKVLEEYARLYGEKMPIDVWTVHAFILREVNPLDYPPEQRPYESWGAGIPPGIDTYKDVQEIYDVSDHGDIEIFKQLIRDFRTWMDARGYRNRPLIVSEFGILMPPNYDAGNGRVYDYEFVSEFMHNTFDFFLTATDEQSGYPLDGNRLVQSWAWYALNNRVNGYFADHDSGAVTPLGEDFARYTAQYGGQIDYVDPAMRRASSSLVQVPDQTPGEQLTITFAITNRGNVRAPISRVRVWLGEPGGTLLKSQPLSFALDPRCRQVFEGETVVSLPALETGYHQLVVDVVAGGARPDAVPENNSKTIVLTAGTPQIESTIHLSHLLR